MRDEEENPDATADDAAQEPRKPYETPKLIERGAVESVTGLVLTKASDGLAGSTLL